MEANKQKVDLATRAALLYFNDNLSQNEIAKLLGISRSYVSQLITLAKDLGIVQITIHAGEIFLSERSFAREAGLQQAFIFTSNSQENTFREFGKFCAPHTLRLIRNVRHIGINLGDTVNRVVSVIAKEDVGDCAVESVVQIMGGFSKQEKNRFGSMPSELVFRMGQLLNCRTIYLNCPGLLANGETKQLLLQEASICSVMQLWKNLDIALMGIGTAGEGVFLQSADALKKKIVASGAVADLNLNMLDALGNVLPLLEDNRMSMGVDDLRKVKTKVVYAHGISKAGPILAAIRAGLIDVLFTDSLTAEEILRLKAAEKCQT